MKLSVTAPVPAGCALIRDVRCWHGGTPNCTYSSIQLARLSKLCMLHVHLLNLGLMRSIHMCLFVVSREVRAIPSAGFHPPWYKPPTRDEHLGSLPHDTWARCELSLGHSAD
eukprot:COSAG02_NODE_3312_length_6955_cov_2.028151_4_plen_112_part_00